MPRKTKLMNKGLQDSSINEESLEVNETQPEPGLDGSTKDLFEAEVIQLKDFFSEKDLIKSIEKYHPSKTRHELAKILVLSLIAAIFVFGVLHVLVNKEIIERLKDFATYSITILSSLTGAAIGFFFRDITDK